jgi:AcrR family transcriptional regulator
MAGPKVLPAKKALPRGRPRQFDKPEAIRKALNLFWERGYEGVSTTELTHAMGIRSPSLYLAFGDKAGVFRAAIELYAAEWDRLAERIATAPSFSAVLEVLSSNAISRFPKRNHPGGCLFLAAQLGVRPEHQSLEAIVVGYRKGFLDLLVCRASEAVANGELASDVDPPSLASFVMAVLQGMATQARDGATSSDLESIAQWKLRVLYHASSLNPVCGLSRRTSGTLR